MSKEVKKLQLVDPTKLNKVLDLLSTIYERKDLEDTYTKPKLLDVIQSRTPLSESRKDKEPRGDTDQINFLRKLDNYKDKIKTMMEETVVMMVMMDCKIKPQH